MDVKKTKYELRNILSRKSGSSHDSLIQAAANHLRSGKRASPMAEEKHQNTIETKKLIDWADKCNLIFNSIDETKFIPSGAEQKVYIKDKQHVIKLNDAIYYASWEDYFYNLPINNYFLYKLVKNY